MTSLQNLISSFVVHYPFILLRQIVYSAFKLNNKYYTIIYINSCFSLTQLFMMF